MRFRFKQVDVFTNQAFRGNPVRDIERAKKFYGEILGLKLGAEYEGKWCEFDTPEGKIATPIVEVKNM